MYYTKYDSCENTFFFINWKGTVRLIWLKIHHFPQVALNVQAPPCPFKTIPRPKTGVLLLTSHSLSTFTSPHYRDPLVLPNTIHNSLVQRRSVNKSYRAGRCVDRRDFDKGPWSRSDLFMSINVSEYGAKCLWPIMKKWGWCGHEIVGFWLCCFRLWGKNMCCFEMGIIFSGGRFVG